MEDCLEQIKVFRALGDPKRAMIVDMLSCGELCACKILEKFDMSQSTLSHHMKQLCECGIVRGRNAGKWTYYSLDNEVIDKAQRFLSAITTEKDHCICKTDAGCCGEGCEKDA